MVKLIHLCYLRMIPLGPENAVAITGVGHTGLFCITWPLLVFEGKAASGVENVVGENSW